MRLTTIFRKLLGVTGLHVLAIAFEGEGIVVDVRPAARKPRCGQCGKKRPAYDRSPPRKWKHLALGRITFWLRYAPQRVSCPACGIRVEQVARAAQRSRFTLEFEEMVAYLAQRMDRTAVAKQLGISWRTVGDVVQRIVWERLDPARLNDLSVIGIDELSFRRNHNYVTVVVDHLKKRVVWIGEGKSAETLTRFFSELGPERARRLTHITMDMSAAFASAVDEHAPHAQKVFDRFHVQRLATDAVDEVRRAEVRDAAGTSQAKALKKTRWALLKSPWNLNQREEQKLADVQRTNRRIYRAYLLKEMLARSFDYRQQGRAERSIDDWLSWAMRSKLKPFVKLAGTIKKHKPGILAYVKTRLTNGLTEGLNNKTRLITRRAYGFHSAHALAAMFHLCCGGITLDPPLPRPTSTA